MARYIDADKIIDALNYNTQNTWGKGLGTSWWSHSVKLKDNIVECINNQPTADVVEVVRCKDCKHSREQDRVFGITDYKCSKHNISCLSPYDFCSYGERSDT